MRTAFVEAELRGARSAQAGLYADDAVLLEPYGPVMEGRAAIRTGLREFDVALQDFRLTSVEVDGGGGLAYDRGAYMLRFLDLHSSAIASETGNYLMVLRKQGNSWFIAALIHNSNQPLLQP